MNKIINENNESLSIIKIWLDKWNWVEREKYPYCKCGILVVEMWKCVQSYV